MLEREHAGAGSARCYFPVNGASAASIPCNCAECHAWNVAPAGDSVSVIVAIGMFYALARLITAWILFGVFCEL